jgi:hypothetical protein
VAVALLLVASVLRALRRCFGSLGSLRKIAIVGAPAADTAAVVPHKRGEIGVVRAVFALGAVDAPTLAA